MTSHGHDGIYRQHMATRPWRRAYLRAWSMAFVVIALIGAWAHDGVVLFAALVSAAACWVWANLPRRWWE